MALFCWVSDWCVEIVGEGRFGYKGHRLAGQQPHTTSGGAREVSFEDHIPGGTALHQPRTS